MQNTVIKHGNIVLIGGFAFVMVIIYWLLYLLSISVQNTSKIAMKNHLKTVNHYQNEAALSPFSRQLMLLANQDKACIVHTVYIPNKASVCPSTSADKKIFIKKSTLI